MRSFRHWSPTYLVNRLALAYDERQQPDNPWLTKTAVEFLDEWLKETDEGLEWGSGRSTVWLAQRSKHVVSVEHHEGWCSKVRELLSEKRVAHKVRYEHKPDGVENSATCAYVQVANEFATESLDFCLVDGVARDHCALASLDKLKPGGLLIVDNINIYYPNPKSTAPHSRKGDDFASAEWRQLHETVRHWRRFWTTNGVTETAFWVKPAR